MTLTAIGGQVCRVFGHKYRIRHYNEAQTQPYRICGRCGRIGPSPAATAAQQSNRETTATAAD